MSEPEVIDDDPGGAARDAPAEDAQRPRRRLGARVLRLAWVCLAAVVLATAGWLGWLLIGTDQLARNDAAAALQEYRAGCGADPATPGEVVGELSLPNSETVWPIMAGVDAEELSGGVGWYPNTAVIGEIGNTVLVGYRVTHGAPFADLLDLNEGDEVQITTCDAVYRYVIEVPPRDLTVTAEDDWVLDAVPGDPGRRPTGKMLTLVTSQDLLPTADRSVGFAVLVDQQPR